MENNIATLPKTVRERLGEMEIGGSIDLNSQEERNNFAIEMSRSFHNKKDADENDEDAKKLFTIRRDKITQEAKVWRLK